MKANVHERGVVRDDLTPHYDTRLLMLCGAPLHSSRRAEHTMGMPQTAHHWTPDEVRALPANRRTVAPVKPLAADLVQRVCPALGGGSLFHLGSTP